MSDADTPARILIVDDHPIVREGLAARIALAPGLEVCGEAEDETSAMALVEQLRPDLVIVDIALEKGNGIDLVKRIRATHPEITTLVHSMYDDALYAERSLEAGAMGYLNKQAARTTMIDAIRDVLAGKVYVSPEMTDRLLKKRVGGVSVEPGASPVEKLSNRELQVLRLIGKGRATREIAEHLHLSVHTIETYREKLKTKLTLESGPELARFATQWVLENG